MVDGYSGSDLLLLEVAGRIEWRLPIQRVIDKNLQLFRTRLLVLVDKG